MNIRQTLTRFELAIQATGTSEGASKGWDSRGRGRAKKNFEPPSSTVKKSDGDRKLYISLGGRKALGMSFDKWIRMERQKDSERNSFRLRD
jgi:hypothetical protein